MKLLKLVEKLSVFSPKIVFISGKDTELYRCQISESASHDSDEKSASTIYLMHGLPTQKEDITGLTYLCLAEDSEIQDRVFQSNILLTSPTHSISVLQKQIDAIFLSQMVLTQHVQELLDIVHQSKGLNTLIEHTANILKNPIIIVDISNKILGYSADFSFAAEEFHLDPADGYLPESIVQELHEDNLYELARKSHFPVQSIRKGQNWILSLVHIHHIEIAHIATFNKNRDFSSEDLELIDYLSRMVSIELQKNDFYKINSSIKHSYFLSDLLDNNVRDLPTMLRRIKNLNWTMTDNLRIMTIFQDHSEVFDRKAQLISARLHAIFPNSRWVVYDGHIVFLLFLDSPSLDRIRNNVELYEFIQKNKLIASISRSFHTIIDVRSFYNESLAAYQLGKRLRPEEILYLYSDFLCYHIGGILAEQYPISLFFHPAVDAIKNHDARHNANLLETLRVFLRYPDNPGTAASILYIHKNTYFYRLSKIRELFHLDLSNGEERLNLHLTLKFMEMK